MKWFGTRRFVCDIADAQQVPVPSGVHCGYCDEVILLGDSGLIIPYSREQGEETIPEHFECFIRQIMGSTGHQRRRCSCYGFKDTSEDGLTRREAARLAFAFSRGLRFDDPILYDDGTSPI